jgi:hypothetical protein
MQVSAVCGAMRRVPAARLNHHSLFPLIRRQGRQFLLPRLKPGKCASGGHPVCFAPPMVASLANDDSQTGF